MLCIVPDLAPTPTPHQKRIRRFVKDLGPAGPMALIATVMPALGAIVVVAVGHEVSRWLKAHTPLSLIPFILAFATLGGFALVPTYANSLLAGWTFGFAVGFPAVMVGLAGAGII